MLATKGRRVAPPEVLARVHFRSRLGHPQAADPANLPQDGAVGRAINPEPFSLILAWLLPERSGLSSRDVP